MKVLVVDDNRNMANIVRLMMEKNNHRVKTATDGDNGYSTYVDFKPDLVVTDIQMPGKSGFDLMTKIRSHNPSIMTIYMTGDPARFLPRFKEEQNRHPVDFISKPFTIADLSTKLSKLQS
jgi:DNA-binding response OmpR family regulator